MTNQYDEQTNEDINNDENIFRCLLIKCKQKFDFELFPCVEQ